MTRRSLLIRCYPPAWRERYGDDLAAYLDDAYAGRLPPRAVASLVVGGLREWVRRARADSVTLAAGARVRAGALMVLAGWSAFVVAGSSFAKLSEHFDAALGPRSHTVADIAYTAVQVLATLSGLAVISGMALAVPALLRFVSSGGWTVVRRLVLRALGVTALTAAATVAVAVWAHSLSDAQRNGGNVGYATLFIAWAALVALLVTLWTVAAVTTARRLVLSRPVLLAEGVLAVVVTIGMLLMLTAAAVWWAAVASAAPWFFGGAVRLASAWTPQLLGTLALMVAALASGLVGVLRIARAVPALVHATHGEPPV
jgi:hypothetical protein